MPPDRFSKEDGMVIISTTVTICKIKIVSKSSTPRVLLVAPATSLVILLIIAKMMASEPPVLMIISL